MFQSSGKEGIALGTVRDRILYFCSDVYDLFVIGHVVVQILSVMDSVLGTGTAGRLPASRS